MNRILYIAGTRRTGSTLLDILLGSSPDACSTGQLAFLHRKERCTCGETLSNCPLWGEVLGAPNLPDRGELQYLGNLTRKEVGLPLFLASKRVSDRYATAHDAIYDAVFEAIDENVLIDSSKNMARILALLRASRHELFVLHVVRDPRGFIGSLRRRNQKSGRPGPWPPRLMAEWLLKQSTASTIIQRLAGDRYLRVQYEDLLQHPARTLGQIATLIDMDLTDVAEGVRAGRAFRPGHIFSGNPVAQNKQVVFDPSRIRTNRLDVVGDRMFWYTVGWPSALWGYDRRQSYLPDAHE